MKKNKLHGHKADIMETKVKRTATFNCSLERAFKTPILCDIKKIHTGYGIMPRVTHCTEDNRWGQVPSSKKIFVARSLLQNGGFAAVDKILERKENVYWRIQVDDFQSWMIGFYKFVGEWKTTEIGPNNILVEYTYTLHSDKPLLYPINWVFAMTFWNAYMKRVLENVRRMAYDNEPYKYE